MSFLVLTHSQEPLRFELGELGATREDFVCRDKNGTSHLLNTHDVVAVMRDDFAEAYGAALAELERLKHGDPKRN